VEAVSEDEDIEIPLELLEPPSSDFAARAGSSFTGATRFRRSGARATPRADPAATLARDIRRRDA